VGTGRPPPARRWRADRAHRDSAAAGQGHARLPGGSGREAAVVAFSAVTESRLPEVGAPWVNQIADTEKRQAAIAGLGRNRLRLVRAAAQTWRVQTDLPVEPGAEPVGNQLIRPPRLRPASTPGFPIFPGAAQRAPPALDHFPKNLNHAGRNLPEIVAVTSRATNRPGGWRPHLPRVASS